VQIVRVMDGLDRYRFLNDAELLATGESASNLLAAPRNGAPRPGPEGPRPTGESGRPHDAGYVSRRR
jgi:hypothetical protein